MNMYCYFCHSQGTTYAMPLFPDPNDPLNKVTYSIQPLIFTSLSLDYECHHCQDQHGVLPITYFGTDYSDIMVFQFAQVSIRNWTISFDLKELTLTHWGTSTYLFKEYPKSPFSQVKVARIPLSYLKKRFSTLEPFT